MDGTGDLPGQHDGIFQFHARDLPRRSLSQRRFNLRRGHHQTARDTHSGHMISDYEHSLVLEVIPERRAVLDFYRRLDYADAAPYAPGPFPMIHLERPTSTEDGEPPIRKS